MGHFVYILLCSDKTYYTGVTMDLSKRIEAHNAGYDPSAYTYIRRPVRLLWSEELPTRKAALRLEKQIKGWSRKKKEALIRNAWDDIHQVVAQERKMREKKKNP